MYSSQEGYNIYNMPNKKHFQNYEQRYKPYTNKTKLLSFNMNVSTNLQPQPSSSWPEKTQGQDIISLLCYL